MIFVVCFVVYVVPVVTAFSEIVKQAICFLFFLFFTVYSNYSCSILCKKKEKAENVTFVKSNLSIVWSVIQKKRNIFEELLISLLRPIVNVFLLSLSKFCNLRDLCDNKEISPLHWTQANHSPLCLFGVCSVRCSPDHQPWRVWMSRSGVLRLKFSRGAGDLILARCGTRETPFICGLRVIISG